MKKIIVLLAVSMMMISCVKQKRCMCSNEDVQETTPMSSIGAKDDCEAKELEKDWKCVLN